MTPRIVVVLSAALLTSVGVAAQNANEQKQEQRFIFRQGQNRLRHRLSHDFDKRKVYKLVNMASEPHKREFLIAGGRRQQASPFARRIHMRSPFVCGDQMPIPIIS